MTQEFLVESLDYRFRINDREIDAHVRGVVLRWIRRNTNRLVNGPSLELTKERDPSLREWVLYASADSVSGDAPKFLEDAVINRSQYRIPQ